MSQTKTIQKTDYEIQKIRRIANLAADLAKAKRVYFDLLKNLIKTTPKETRSATAKYAALLRKALKGKDVDPAELGEALIEMKREWRSWRAEHKEDLEIVKAAARDFYKKLTVLTELVESTQ